MTLYNFIFSGTRTTRLKRHLVFWGAYTIVLLYRHIPIDGYKDFLSLRTYVHGAVNLILWLPLPVLSVYIFVEFLVPRLLQRKKYFSFIAGASLAFIFNILIAYFIAIFYFDYIFTYDTGQQLTDSFRAHGIRMLVTFHAITLGIPTCLFVSGIKIAKMLYLQQVENTKLTIEKSKKNILSAKNRIQPAFLLQSLNSVYHKVYNMEPDAPEIILQLSELLSYILYDCNESRVPLTKELSMSRSLINIQKLKSENKFNLILQTDGDPGNKRIRPLLLFTQIQNILQELPEEINNHDTQTINLIIDEDPSPANSVDRKDILDKEIKISIVKTFMVS